MQARVIDTYLSYREEGIRKGSEFLFSRDAAIHLIDDMKQLDILCLGATGWYKAVENQPWLAEDLSADYSIPNELPSDRDEVQLAAELTKEFIRAGLNERDEYVSVTFQLPIAWQAIEKAWDAVLGPTYP